jgi:hypothetical protein
VRDLVLDFVDVRPWATPPADGAPVAFKVHSGETSASGLLSGDWRALAAEAGLRLAPMGSVGAEVAVRDTWAGPRAAPLDGGVPEAARALGRALWARAFHGEAASVVRAALTETRLRVVIRASAAHPWTAEVLSLPWEMLEDHQADGQPLGLRGGTSILRVVERATAPKQVDHGGRDALVVLGPIAAGRDALDLDSDVAAIVAALGAARVTVLRAPTLDGVRRALAERRYRVLHLAGHGRFNYAEGVGSIELADPEPVPGAALALALCGVDAPPELVVLNVCHGGTLRADRPFESLALALLARARAVVAMQSQVPDPNAAEFCRALYSRLAAGDAVDAAAAEGRRVVFAGSWRWATWALPAVYTRSATPWRLAPRPVDAPPRDLHAVRAVLIAHTADLAQVARIAGPLAARVKIAGAPSVAVAWQHVLHKAAKDGPGAVAALLSRAAEELDAVRDALER